MKKNKLLLLLLSIIMIFSFALVGCNKPTKPTTPQQPSDIEHIDREDNNPDGVHKDESITLTNDILNNGVSNYSIVISDNASPLIKRAEKEFNYFFNIATGVSLPVLSDASLVHNANNKFISIGDNNIFASSGLSVDKLTLGSDGHQILTKDNTVFLIGGSDYGSLFAVYTFMNTEFNYECYYHDTFEIDKNIKNVKLKDYKITNIPDIAFRALNYGIYHYDTTKSYDRDNFKYRMGMCKSRGENMMGIHKEFDINSHAASSTNCEWYIPYAKYNNPDDTENYHPKWFSDRSNDAYQQWCYTAHGDKAEYDEMIDLCARKIEFSLTNYPPTVAPNKNIVTITMQDNDAVCQCEHCKNAAKKYGAESGAVVVFVNNVAEKVHEWMNLPENKDYKRDDLQIIFFAYKAFQQAPTVYNETEKKWVPTQPEVALRDDVGVYLAINTTWDYQQSVFAPINENGKKIFESWSDISQNIYLWTYSTNFPNHMYMYDSVNFFNTEGYQYLVDNNTKFFFNQAQDTNPVSTAWHNLKLYLDAKLAWNCNLNTEELTIKWFKAMFGDAWAEMKDLYEEMRVYNRNTCIKNGILNPGKNWQKINNENFWELATLDSWIAKFDHAKLALEKYKTINPDYYNRCVNHIELEAVFPIFAELEIYGGDTGKLSISRNKLLYDRMFNDIKVLELERMNIYETYSGAPISDFLKNR